MCVLVTQLGLTVCDSMDSNLQAPWSMRVSRQEYLSGLPVPSPGDAPDLGVKPGFSTLQADSLPSEPPGNFNQGQ